ncbi:MAG: hypothetical protein VX777_08025 [Chlamydiota bacterium]|nr:hypothetical protein [Chlamydiota bacterium]
MKSFTELYRYNSCPMACVQSKRIASKRLMKANNSNYSQWKGRGVCLLYSLYTVVREPWRMVKHTVQNVHILAEVIHSLFNLQFKQFYSQTVLLGSSIASLIMRPISMVKEAAQYGFGAIVHPKFVIEPDKVVVL